MPGRIVFQALAPRVGAGTSSRIWADHLFGGVSGEGGLAVRVMRCASTGTARFFDVVGHYVAAGCRRRSIRAQRVKASAPRMEGADLDAFVVAVASDQSHDVSEDRVVEMHGFADVAHAQHVFAGEHRMHGGGAVGDVDLFQDVDAHVVAWIADGGLMRETVHLRFRQLQVVPSCSIGFWVAMTMNGCGTGWVTPSTVTFCLP